MVRKPVKRTKPRRHEPCDCGSGQKAGACCYRVNKPTWFDTEEGGKFVSEYNEKVCKLDEDRYRQIVRWEKDMRPPYKNKMQIFCSCGLYHSVDITDGYKTFCVTHGFRVEDKEWDQFMKKFMEKSMEVQGAVNAES